MEAIANNPFNTVIECNHCKSILSFNDNDICFTTYSENYYVICPICNKRIYIDEINK